MLKASENKVGNVLLGMFSKYDTFSEDWTGTRGGWIYSYLFVKGLR